MFQAAKELETKRQSRGFVTFCLSGDLGACIVKLLGLESTAPSAVPTRAAWPAKFRGSAWRDLSRKIPSVPLLSRCRTSILLLTRILCDGTNHRSGGRSAHRDLGTRESRGFKAQCHLFPVFFQFPGLAGTVKLAPQSCLVSNDNRKRIAHRNTVLYVLDPSPSPQILPGLHNAQTAPDVASQMCPRGHGGTRHCWTDDHVHDYDCATAVHSTGRV